MVNVQKCGTKDCRVNKRPANRASLIVCLKKIIWSLVSSVIIDKLYNNTLQQFINFFLLVYEYGIEFDMIHNCFKRKVH